MNYQWSWASFIELSPDGIHTYLQTLLIGTGWTLLLSILAYLFALAFGSVIGIMRTMRSRPAKCFAASYVEVFRNIPLIVQMFLWYFVLPELLPKAVGASIKQMPQPWGQFFPALLCLGFYGTARISETLRAGICSLRAGQHQAALALGFSGYQAYRLIILPQAFRIVIPPLTSEFMATIKYSSVAMTIGLLELTGSARSMQEFSFHIFEAFSAATVIYFAINTALVCVLFLVEKKVFNTATKDSSAIELKKLTEAEHA